jgi:predicted cupin superfamily sugar epimerase
MLVPGGRFALLGTTMAPGFDPSCYEQGRLRFLLKAYPGVADRIEAFFPVDV